MRAVVQRVKEARVLVDGKVVGAIDRGLAVFIGIGKEDGEKDIEAMADKVAGLRIFPSGEQETAICVKDVGGKVLMISQFTLFGDVRKGKRPSFSDAMNPADALVFYEKCCLAVQARDIPVEKGVFQAMMQVELINDGPYTILIDTKKAF